MCSFLREHELPLPLHLVAHLARDCICLLLDRRFDRIRGKSAVEDPGLADPFVQTLLDQLCADGLLGLVAGLLRHVCVCVVECRVSELLVGVSLAVSFDSECVSGFLVLAVLALCALVRVRGVRFGLPCPRRGLTVDAVEAQQLFPFLLCDLLDLVGTETLLADFLVFEPIFEFCFYSAFVVVVYNLWIELLFFKWFNDIFLPLCENSYCTRY